jgi:hypothetical protein
MPITQDRFLAIIEGADALIRRVNFVRGNLADAPIADLNSVIDHHPDDPILQDTLRDTINLLHSLRETLTNNENEYINFLALIQLERRYFATARGRNIKAQNYRKLRRYGANAHLTDTEGFAPPPPAPSLEAQRAIARNIEQVEREREAEARRLARRYAEAEAASPPPPEPLAQASPKIKTHAGMSYDPEVLRTSIPSLEELNKPDFSDNEDLL